MQNINPNQCPTCVFNRDYFTEFCKKNGKSDNCPEYASKVDKKCAVCDVKLDVVEWFNFGNKCAMHGIED